MTSISIDMVITDVKEGPPSHSDEKIPDIKLIAISDIG